MVQGTRPLLEISTEMEVSLVLRFKPKRLFTRIRGPLKENCHNCKVIATSPVHAPVSANQKSAPLVLMIPPLLSVQQRHYNLLMAHEDGLTARVNWRRPLPPIEVATE